jgi:hypothetical protein
LAWTFFTTSAATADPISSSFTYNTTGELLRDAPSSNDVPGPAALAFEPVTGGAYDASSTLSLGRFVVTPPSQGVTTYHDTPFFIALNAPQFGATVVDPAPPGTPYSQLKITENFGGFMLRGWLNGTVSSTGQSDVVATFASTHPDPLYWGPVPADQRVLKDVLPVAMGDLTLPNTLDITSAADVVVAVSTPEPQSLAVFLVALLGIGAYGRRFAGASRTGDG